MKLLSIRVYSGRNIYSHWPVVRVDVDLGRYLEIPTCDINGFNAGLIALLPGIKEHKCSRGYEGGFWERLEIGTYLPHVMEHMALEIQKILGYDVRFGKTRYLENETVYSIVYSYDNPKVGLESGILAFDIIDALLNQKNIDLEERLEEIRKKAIESSLGPSTAAIVKEAEKRGIPVLRLGENSLIQLGYGKYSKRIQATMTERSSCIAVDLACDKEMTNHILSLQGIPVPKGKAVETVEEAYNVARSIGFPVVVKPYDGNQGKGVSLDLKNEEDIERAFIIAKQFSERILVEEFIKGKHYRIAVVGGKVVAVSQRIEAHVVGNGKNTIRELIEIENTNPLRGEGHEKPLTKIKIDDVMLLLLQKNGQSLEDIPQDGQIVYLRENDNLSTGGIAIDVTDEIHADNIRLAVNAVRAIGLDVAGVDLTAEDIGKSILETGGAIIEVNACPGIRMHHYPSKGKSRNVAKAIVDMIFPEGEQHSLPIISVTGTNGKTTTTRMLAKIMAENNLTVGMTSTGGVYIGDELIIKGDTTGPKSAQAILMDKRTEVAVLETARGGIVNRGLGYDLADVGIITNIGDDHLGIDGINTLEDMADVKALVVEAVKSLGYAVLNAEDAYTERIANRVRCRIIYFSLTENNPIIIKHKEKQGKAVYLKEGIIYLFDGYKEIPVIAAEDIPATFGGVLKHNIENSMAAIAGAYGLGVEISVISRALSKFYTDFVHNPGRFNVFDVKDFKVIIDYGHNLDGYSKVLSSLKVMKRNQLIGVIGVPGDRTDISTLKVGEVSGKYFDKVYIKEDKDLRGRKQGEVANLLKKGCIVGGLSEEQIEIELCEIRALKKAMKKARAGDIVVVFYENYKPLFEAVEEFKRRSEAQKNQCTNREMAEAVAKA